MPVVPYLSNATSADFVHFTAAFSRGLAETGYVEGRNVAVEYCWRKASTIDCRSWRPIWFALRHWRRKRRPLVGDFPMESLIDGNET